MSESYFLACDTVLVDKGDHNQRFNRGDELIDVPDGAMDSLVRRGKAVTCEDYKAMFPYETEQVEDTEVDPVETVTTDNTESPGKPEWMQSPIVALHLPANIARALGEVGIGTVEEMLHYGASHEGSMTSIMGIGKAGEQEIREAIVALQQQ